MMTIAAQIFRRWSENQGTAPPTTPARAFTLFELLVATTIIALIAVVFIPMLGDDQRPRLMAASSILSSDIELAQVMTISYPSAPVVVKFDPSNNRYWLAYKADPDTPIDQPETGEPYLIEFGVGRARSAAGVTFKLEQMTNDTLEFNPQGGVAQFGVQPSIELSRGQELDITLAIAPDTGTVTQVADDEND